MNILVCGGAGYIGSSLARMLEERGDRVIVFDNLGTGSRSAVDHPRIKFVEGNLLNERNLYQLFRQYELDATYHLALRSPYTTNQPNIALCYRNNLGGTMNLLNEMRTNDVNHIVFASSAVVYGDDNGRARSEKQAVSPGDGFASTNVAIEQMLLHFGQEYGLNSVSLRFSNASGIDSLSSHSDLHERNNSDLLEVLNACRATGNTEYKILGDDHSTADGTVVKEYLHVLDVCDAHVKAMDYLLQDNNGAHLYNLGGDRGYSARELIAIAEHITGNKVATTMAKPENGPALQTLSSDRAKKDLNWKPRYNVEAIMKALWQAMSRPKSEQSRVGESYTNDTEAKAYKIMDSKPGVLKRLKMWYHMALSATIDSIKVR